MIRLLIVFVLLFTIVANGQTKKEKKAIKTYRVKVIIEYVVDVVNGKEITRKDSYTVYDKNANVLQNEEYRKDGTLKHKETAKYDSKENKLEETVWDAAELQPNPERYYKHVCKYDSEENKLEELTYDINDKLVSKAQFSYNMNNDRTLEVVYDAAGKLLKRVIYTYNSKGLKVERKEYDGSNNLLSTRKYIYEF
ncbi:MAG TPA: hypothetical protein VFL70_05385 [Bacteroidia bacterium]|nr:hypothetical protein [Bacteroidia bacterium]